MKKKADILVYLKSNIDKAPKDARPMLVSQQVLIDVLIDIRDILNQRLTEISGDLYKVLTKD